MFQDMIRLYVVPLRYFVPRGLNNEEVIRRSSSLLSSPSYRTAAQALIFLATPKPAVLEPDDEEQLCRLKEMMLRQVSCLTQEAYRSRLDSEVRHQKIKLLLNLTEICFCLFMKSKDKRDDSDQVQCLYQAHLVLVPFLFSTAEGSKTKEHVNLITRTFNDLQRLAIGLPETERGFSDNWQKYLQICTATAIASSPGPYVLSASSTNLAALRGRAIQFSREAFVDSVRRQLHWQHPDIMQLQASIRGKSSTPFVVFYAENHTNITARKVFFQTMFAFHNEGIKMHCLAEARVGIPFPFTIWDPKDNTKHQRVLCDLIYGIHSVLQRLSSSSDYRIQELQRYFSMIDPQINQSYEMMPSVIEFFRVMGESEPHLSSELKTAVLELLDVSKQLKGIIHDPERDHALFEEILREVNTRPDEASVIVVFGGANHIKAVFRLMQQQPAEAELFDWVVFASNRDIEIEF